MAEPLYLELPSTGHASRRTLRRLLAILTTALSIVAVTLGWWLYSGRVASVAARLDGMVHVVAPRFSGHLASLDVKEGDAVTTGQPIGSMETGAYDRQLAQAAAEAAALRPPQGPDIVESAARLRQAQEAERDFAVRIAQARHEEDTLRQLREERVTEHVRAQLALRSLDSQGGERAVGKQEYAAACEAEALARTRKDAVVAEFERASLMRAAMAQELGRIRQEIMAARAHASQRRVAQRGTTERLAADGTLFAPVGGTVLRRLAEPGQLLQAGEPALFIAPAGQNSGDAFWVDAWFPAGEGNTIRAGQRCSITIGDVGLSGTVREVLPPQPLPEGVGASSPATDSGGAASLRRSVAYLPVRIALNEELPRGLTPGATADCVVMTHGLSF